MTMVRGRSGEEEEDLFASSSSSRNRRTSAAEEAGRARERGFEGEEALPPPPPPPPPPPRLHPLRLFVVELPLKGSSSEESGEDRPALLWLSLPPLLLLPPPPRSGRGGGRACGVTVVSAARVASVAAVLIDGENFAFFESDASAAHRCRVDGDGGDS